MSTDLDWRRLGAKVLARREELGLAQAALQPLGGPSPSTIQKIELFEVASLKGATKIKLEIALGWTRGSVDRILRGAEPALILPPGAGGRVEVLYEGNGERILIDIVNGVGELSVDDRREILAFIRLKNERHGP